MSKHNTPALRFEGFDGEWVSTTFGETAQLSRGLTYSPRDVVNANEGVRVYRSSNIQNLSVVTSPDDVWVNPKAVDIPFLTEGNILITASNGSVRLVGKSGIVKKLSAPGVPGGFMLKCVSALPTFTAGLLQSPWYKDFLNVHVAGGNGAIGNLDSKRLSDEMVSLPSTSEEQRAIGELFADLDALIEQHRAKHANLQQTKTALLQRMFPQDGADEPELRLGGFSGAWEPRIMRDCAEYSKGSGYSKKDIADEGTPVIHYGRLYTNYETAITDVDTFASPEPDALISRGGEVLVPASGETAEDIAIASALLQSGVLIGGDLNVIRPRRNIDPVFLALSLSNGVAKENLVKRAQGKSVVHLRNSDIQDVEIFFPTLEEQRAIGEVFTNLDALIAPESRYITQLTQAKTALLQRMFV